MKLYLSKGSNNGDSVADEDDSDVTSNEGTLIIDVTVAPQNNECPQYVNLLSKRKS
jgi:hypothetical protein